jgi:hypothetical protein
VGESSIDCEKVASIIKKATDKLPVIYLHGSLGGRCSWADHDLSSHEPEALLELVRSLFGDPRTLEPASDEKLQGADANPTRVSSARSRSRTRTA